MTENFQIYYFQSFLKLHWFACLYVFNLIICIWANRGSKDKDDQVLSFIVSLVPGVGFLVGVCLSYKILKRIKKSKGKCIFGHTMVETYSSEKEKVKNGRRPIRISVGGTKQYSCTRCTCSDSVRWSAF